MKGIIIVFLNFRPLISWHVTVRGLLRSSSCVAAAHLSSAFTSISLNVTTYFFLGSIHSDLQIASNTKKTFTDNSWNFVYISFILAIFVTILSNWLVGCNFAFYPFYCLWESLNFWVTLSVVRSIGPCKIPFHVSWSTLSLQDAGSVNLLSKLL